MARNKIPGKPGNTPRSGTDAIYAYEEREREDCYVMGSADHPYGTVDGFRFGLESTGHKHRESPLGRLARRGR